MKGNISHFEIHGRYCDFEMSALNALNPVLLLLLIPVLDLVLVPLLRHAMLHPTILKRLGIGAGCTLLSALSLLTLEGVEDRRSSEESDVCVFDTRTVYREKRDVNSYWLFVPMVLVTIAEIFIYIPGENTLNLFYCTALNIVYLHRL